MDAAWPTKDGQFQLVRRDVPPPRGSVRHLLERHAIDTYGDVPVVKVCDKTRRMVGALIGRPIPLEAGLLPAILQVDQTVDAETADEWVEERIYSLTGSFIFVLDIAGCSRIYLDADGSKSLVYDPARKIAAATAMTILDAGEYNDRLQRELYDKLGVAQAGWFPAGLTAHKGISRLICNHYLDLDDWTARRHWPIDPIVPSADPAATFDAMLVRIRQTVEILKKSGEVKIALTAGTDSRFILSALHPIVRDITLVTVAAPTGALDVHTAARLAKDFDLRHEILPYRGATKEEAAQWQIRAGHCIAGANMTMHPSVAPLKGQYFVGGLGGEVGRGFLWLAATSQTAIDARGIIDRLKLPREPQIVEAVARWLEPIAHFDTFLKLDLAYLELRMSSWAFADAYANPVQGELHPMISRDNYTAMLSAPAEMRRDGTAFREAICRAWPELLSLPINRYGDWRDVAKRGLDGLRNPRKAVRKVKQIVLTRGQAM